jgi:rhamnulose-1-phosphate aldolase
MENQNELALTLYQNPEIRKLLDEIAEVAGYLWERGWAERNAGNISVNVTGFFTPRELAPLVVFPPCGIPAPGNEIGGHLLMITGTGTRMRDMAKNPAENVCFVYIRPDQPCCHLICHCKQGACLKPSSELPTHLAIHQELVRNNAAEKVVLHSHVLELIAITQLPEFQSEEALNRMLWGMHPETVIFVPEGIGFIPYTIPGTEMMATATLKGFGKHRVIVWEKHGCMAIGKSLREAFDTIDILAKSARIWFLCKSAGREPEGLTPGELIELRDHYSL